MLHLRRYFSKLPSLPSNYFDIFSIPPHFDIDLAELAQTYRNLQSTFHPDKHVMSSPSDQENAAQQSALLNAAYKCLRDPYCRARAMLKTKNHDPNVREMDPDFLVDMMDFNEQVELCDDGEMVEQLLQHNGEALDALYSQFEGSFSRGDYVTAADSLAKVKFVLQTKERIEQIAEAVGQ